MTMQEAIMGAFTVVRALKGRCGKAEVLTEAFRQYPALFPDGVQTRGITYAYDCARTRSSFSLRGLTHGRNDYQ